jgi:hypothetical protein
MNAIATNRKVIRPPSEVYKKHVCTCDRCGDRVSTSFGDRREQVFKIDENGNKYDIKMVCSHCIDVLFIEHELPNKPDLFDYL